MLTYNNGRLENGVPYVDSVDPTENTFDRIIAYEDGHMSENQKIALFQELIETGLIVQLQGHYQRNAQRYVDAGLINLPKYQPA